MNVITRRFNVNYIEEVLTKSNTMKSVQIPLPEILKMVKKGWYLLPDFQRGYVWDLNKVKELLISIINDSVIGGVTIWRTSEQIKVLNMIEDIPLIYQYENHFILDGQQRITSLYYADKGGFYKKYDFSTLKVNLNAESLEEMIIVTKKKEPHLIPFCEIKNAKKLFDTQQIDMDGYSTLISIQKHFQKYSITAFQIATDDLDNAIYQFNALNTSGKKMVKEDIVFSRIYSKNFKLKDKLKKLLERTKTFNINEKDAISALTLCIKGSNGTNDVLKLEVEEVIKSWERFEKFFKITCDYLISIGYANLKSLPYKNCFYTLNAIFYDLQLTSVNHKQNEILIKFVLVSALTSRYAKDTTKITSEDVKVIGNMVRTETDGFEPVEITDEDLLEYGKLSSRSAYQKGIQWALLQYSPRSFKNNNLIVTSGITNSEQYTPNAHHIFPKNYMKGRKIQFPYDHIVNICYIEADVNQKDIRDKAPSVYFDIFAETNDKIKSTCETHLIDYDLVVTDNYDFFFVDRREKIKELLYCYL